MAALVSQYVAAVRANPGQAKSAENVLRMGIFTMTDASSLIQVEGGMAACNVLSLLHELILDPTLGGGKKAAGSEAARILHRAVCELQCLLELVARRSLFAGRPRAAHRVVVGVEALKSTLIVASRWRTVAHTLRRAAATLTAPPAVEYDSALGRPQPPSSQRGVRIPAVALDRVDPVTGAVTPAPFTSWREWLLLFVDAAYLARPVWYAYAALIPWRRNTVALASRGGAAAGVNAVANIARKSSFRSAWRAWLISLVVEAVLVLATFAAEAGAPPIVAQVDATLDADFGEPVGPAAAASGEPEALSQRRLRSLGSYLGRNPFFGRYLRHIVERYVVRGWVARNVPLVGGMIAYQARLSLQLQRECFLYTAGGATASAATAFEGAR